MEAETFTSGLTAQAGGRAWDWVCLVLKLVSFLLLCKPWQCLSAFQLWLGFSPQRFPYYLVHTNPLLTPVSSLALCSILNIWLRVIFQKQPDAEINEAEVLLCHLGQRPYGLWSADYSLERSQFGGQRWWLIWCHLLSRSVLRNVRNV